MSAGYRTACFYYFDSSHQVIEMTVTTAESRAWSLLKELEEEIAALKKRRATLGQLAVSEDYVLFFKVRKCFTYSNITIKKIYSKNMG